MTDSDVQIQWHYDVEKPDLALETYKLRDESRTLAFTGVKLASISSGRDSRPRWTKIEIYRTKGGAFIAYRIGVSTVVHSITCMTIGGKRLPGPESIPAWEMSIEKRTPCNICRPNIKQALADDPQSLRLEVNRYWTAMCDTAEELYKELHTTRHGELTLSYLATTLLVNAAQHDAQISAVVEEHKLR
ncbi:hypothetical protein SEA_FORZA_181 [Gordonia phage Forza]|uniref:Uncharacterized protein n=1 Tax=Gordonia phage Forza TaxID=2571247 RepID=A0A650FB21_9CAUD|nr:hypothetical protein PP303_gp147 [Gordonia phage Forza]QGT55142.1 hypothetical protein SEA_FORZA_181 [Gordonia phage Forza]UXE04290.1 hypothetical protein SEA_BLUENGOLD_177 [Gordonia phage BlueNGold]